MSPSEIKSNSRPVEAQQDNLGVSTIMQDSSSADIIHDPKKLKDRIMDLVKGDTEFSKMKQGDQALVIGTASGLFTAVLPLLAVGATLAIPGAIVGLTLYFAAKVAVKAVQSGYKGLKWSAEKTVEGAKHIGGKIKDGYEYSADSLKRGASFVSERAANKFHKAAGKEDYSDKIKRFTKEEIEKSDKIRDDLKEIFADKGNNDGLIKDILSGISSKIALKIQEVLELDGSNQDLERLLVQEKFINGLSKKSLHSLLTQRSLPKDTYLIDSIFSEHHDEIKEVIRECKENHFSLRRSNSEQSNSLSGSSSMNSLSTTSSKAELLNPNEHKEVKATTSLWNKVCSPFKGDKKPEEFTYISYKDSELDQIQSAEIGNSRFYVAPPKPPRSNSMGSIGTDSTPPVPNLATIKAPRSKSLTSVASPTVPTKSSPCSSSVDSGIDSSNSSTPQRHSPSQETRFGLGVTEELAEKLAKRRVIVDQPNVESVQQKAEPSKG